MIWYDQHRLSTSIFLLRDGNTALIRASQHGHEKVVDLLLQADADHAAVNKWLSEYDQHCLSTSVFLLRDGRIALIWASRYGTQKVVDLLLQAGADHAVVDAWLSEIDQHCLSTSVFLLRDGNTALIVASRYGQEKVVDFLLQAGADHVAVNKWLLDIHQHYLPTSISFLRYGKTALIWASVNGHEKVVDLLLQAGADHASVNKWLSKIYHLCLSTNLFLFRNGYTVLILASESGHEKVVELLLKTGADHAAVNKWLSEIYQYCLSTSVFLLRDGNTALILASENGHEKVVDLLLQAGTDHAANKWLSEIHQYCLSTGVFLFRYGNTALILASRYGHEKVVDHLLQAGADHAAVNKWLSAMHRIVSPQAYFCWDMEPQLSFGHHWMVMKKLLNFCCKLVRTMLLRMSYCQISISMFRGGIHQHCFGVMEVKKLVSEGNAFGPSPRNRGIFRSSKSDWKFEWILKNFPTSFYQYIGY